MSRELGIFSPPRPTPPRQILAHIGEVEPLPSTTTNSTAKYNDPFIGE
jgi:hypothetical protein